MSRLLKLSFILLIGFLGGMAGSSIGESYAKSDYVKDAFIHYARFLNPVEIQLLVALAGALIGVLIAAHASTTLQNFVETIEKTPARDKVAILAGVMLGLIFTALSSLLVWQMVSTKPAAIMLIVLVGYIFVSLGIVAMRGMKRELFGMFANEMQSLDDAPLQRCKILDTNIIIDGRISDICRTGFVEGPIYVPGFVLDELQRIADSGDSLKRARGRRGLDILHQMQKDMKLIVRSFDLPDSGPNEGVDLKLVKLGKQLNGAIITNDYNLNRVAELQGVTVLNINELAGALKPVVLAGEELTVTIIKEGKEANQGIAYLDDGTMVVVEGAKRFINATVDIVVSSLLQTIAGKMIFAELKTDHEETDDNVGRHMRTYSGGRSRRKVP